MAAAGNLATTRDRRFARLFVTKPSAGPARYHLAARVRVGGWSLYLWLRRKKGRLGAGSTAQRATMLNALSASLLHKIEGWTR